jgi:O-methyltransferase
MVKENSKMIDFGQKLFSKYPILRPWLSFTKKMFFVKPKFSGWGMTTLNQPPWLNESKNTNFIKTSQDIKKKFQLDKKIHGINEDDIDELKWRHWIVTSLIKYSIKFTDVSEYNFVECGVGWGMSAFFALREINVTKDKIVKPKMHLYDSWQDMRKSELLDSEEWHINQYSNLNIELTKKNLEEFEEETVFHIGFIPEVLHDTTPPNKIIYLHIDLNSANATTAALDFFYDKLVIGGIILFDDYGWDAYKDTKNIVDEFFKNKPGILIEFPTGQAVYFQK